MTNRKKGRRKNVNKQGDDHGIVQVKTGGTKPNAMQQLESKQSYCQRVTNDKGLLEGKVQTSLR
jgi:hypothetical protein